MASAVQLLPKKTSRRASTRQVRSQFHRLRIVLNKRIACTPMAVVLTEHGVSLSGSELGGVNRQSLVAVCAPLQAVIGAGCTHNYSAVSASRYRHSGVRLINLSPTIGWPLSLSLSLFHVAAECGPLEGNGVRRGFPGKPRPACRRARREKRRLYPAAAATGGNWYGWVYGGSGPRTRRFSEVLLTAPRLRRAAPGRERAKGTAHVAMQLL